MSLCIEEVCFASHPCTTAKTSTPTVCTSQRTTERWIPTSLHWTLASPSTSLASAPWHWWRSTPRQASPPGSRFLSECKNAALQTSVISNIPKLQPAPLLISAVLSSHSVVNQLEKNFNVFFSKIKYLQFFSLANRSTTNLRLLGIAWLESVHLIHFWPSRF